MAKQHVLKSGKQITVNNHNKINYRANKRDEMSTYEEKLADLLNGQDAKIKALEAKNGELSDKVAELREALYEYDRAFFESRLGEIVFSPESCIDVILEWIKQKG